ncbi:MAG: glycoside hydrolase family 2 TIM barrel-domain containing protein [Reichenbachiella sp.]|uniref:glycoside hydrolase family 2 TIM barrel-domain containing protein n=1 Tax=Reichenbachiella sp. TaxID=2184521 RepID=UPI002966650C|nr:glycoside hydrolase family 2 TIM barrel-domain containing protein [Reichenbachiella sp.]MDW3212020.1 glycoside hydrolase family 2 TIM barrel-domain containing protein [Reichenbachiella sp.]
MIRKILGIAAGMMWLVNGGVAQQRVVENINDNWSYLELPVEHVSEVKNKDGWTPISLPHSWNGEDAVDVIPGYRRSISWYKKSLSMDVLDNDKRYFLYFEGVNIKSSIFVNGQLAGDHVGGYIGFEIEISSFLQKGENEILVKVDNGYDREVIPSQKSDFFIYGGITRDVWLKSVSQTFLSDIKITTDKVSAQSATTLVELTLDGPLSKNQEVKVLLVDPDGQVVAQQTVKAEAKTSVKFKTNDPQLWHVDTPHLYEVKAELFNGKKLKDQVSDRFGMRWFEFQENGPFYLNGERLIIRGTHRHEEHAGVGPAMTNEMHRTDMELIKGMGANFVRLAHYPQDPEIYRACDELGILVWDELPWCRGGVGNDQWKTNTSQMLAEIIQQNYNHPSVILWSLGNEIYWLPDFEDGDHTNEINSYLKELNDLAHKLDPSRQTAIRKYYEGADIVDVFSPSIWSGWYSGTYENYEAVIDQSIAKYPRFLHMEYGGSSHVGRHTETPITGKGFVDPSKFEEEVNQVEVKSVAKSGDWSENYIVDLFDWYLSITENHEQFAGNAQWAFKDFGTPLRPENDIPYMNQKGLADRAGNPKDAYYVFKSYWSDEPFAYIESHTWTERSGPKGEARNVCVYSNSETVELFQNGNSLGVKTRDTKQFPAAGLNWDVDFVAGENELLAVGMKDGQEIVKDSLVITYSYEQAGSPSELVLSSEWLENGNYLVTVTAVDKGGLRCLDYEERVYFQCLGGGDLIKNQGTPTGSEVIKMANGKASIEVKPNDNPGPLKMTVLNQYFKGTFLNIDKSHAKEQL